MDSGTKNWFSDFLNDLSLNVTQELRKRYSNVRFVVLSQKEHADYHERRIMFILGPYVLCTATNKVYKNKLVEEWTRNSAYIPFGEFFKDKKLTKELITKTNNSRKYKITGDIEAVIEETFHNMLNVNIAVFCGSVISSEEDVDSAKSFISSRDADFYLFAETFPFSRMPIQKSIFRPGTVYGRYGYYGPETYFFNGKKSIYIHKSTPFANEKRPFYLKRNPKIITYNGMRVAIVVCYDLLNPRLAFVLSKSKVDFVLVPAMIPKDDVKKWKDFLYVRGQEIQCPIILASNEDKRKICISLALYYDPIEEMVKESNEPCSFGVVVGEVTMNESPKVHWSWLLHNKVFGPFTKDF